MAHVIKPKKSAKRQTKTVTAKVTTSKRKHKEVIKEDRPIWDVIEEIMSDVPEEVLDKLPTDGAANLDHYVYGSPKKSS